MVLSGTAGRTKAFAADGRGRRTAGPSRQPPGRCGGDARGLHGGTRPESAPASGPWGARPGWPNDHPTLVVPDPAGHAKVEKSAALGVATLRPRSLPGDRPTIPPGAGRRRARAPPAARGGVV